MRMIVLAFSLMALAAPAHAAQKTNARNNDASIEQKCREWWARSNMKARDAAALAASRRSASASA